MVTKAYHGGSFYGAIGEDFSSLERHKDIICADTLDAWYPPSPKVLEKVSTYMPFLFQASPPTHSSGLLHVLSEKRGIPVKNIALGAGTSGLMFTFFPLVLHKEDSVLILDPMYGEYQHIFEHVIGCNVIRHSLHQEESFDVNTETLLQEVQKHTPRMIVIVNPNSPTGRYWKKEDILHVLSAIPKETLFVIDETYIEYVGDDASMETDVLEHPNLIILKSMSKIYALSGARVGYMVASNEIVEQVLQRTPPWIVSHFGQVAAVEALNDWSYYQGRIAETQENRKSMINALESISSITITESVGNYFLMQLKTHKASELVEELKKENIFLRNCDSMSAQFHDDVVRVSVRDRESNDKVVESITSHLKMD